MNDETQKNEALGSVLFDDHSSGEASFQYCATQHVVFVMAPTLIAETKWQWLVKTAKSHAQPFELVYLSHEGTLRVLSSAANAESMDEVYSLVQAWSKKMQPKYEGCARLYHELALAYRANMTPTFKSLCRDRPEIKGWREDALNLHLLKYISKVMAHHQDAASPLHENASRFLSQLQSKNTNFWLNRICDAEYARYAAAAKTLSLYTKDKLLQSVTVDLGGQVAL